MNKLAIFSLTLFLLVFIPSMVLIIAYILGIGGVGQYHETWVGRIWFLATLLIINSCAFFFPVYYLQIISSIRKHQRANELDLEKNEIEPYFYDMSKFINSLKRYYIWHYKDTIRDNRIRSKKKKLKEAEIVKNIQ
mgnify:CR=1 FL=1|tara:strand:- start:47 stop:454 length:408 start_codon:yes stop_codon:yes gene_type:complete